MSTLIRASELVKLPVVTWGGEDVAQIKDIVYAAHGGQIEAFTLAGRGLFAGPLKTALPWAKVSGLGSAAVIIESEQDLIPLNEVLAQSSVDGPGRGDVLNSQVLTDEGSALGTVSDVVIGILGDPNSGQADVVGYEIVPADTISRGKQRLLIPLPDTIAASGEHLMVPASASNFLTDDLVQFGSVVDAFRAQLGEKH